VYLILAAFCTQTAELGTFDEISGAQMLEIEVQVQKTVPKCVSRCSQGHKSSQIMLKTMKMRDLRAD
jgi:hypothetical protein